MRHPDDPARLVEDPNAPAPLVEALRAARGPAPDPARLASLGLALGLQVPAAIAPPAPLAPAPATPLASPAAVAAGVGAAKVALTGIAAVGVAAAVAVGGFGVGRGKAPPPTRPIPAVVETFEARAPEPFEEAALPIDESAAPAPAAAPASRRRHHARPAPAAPVAAAPPAEAPADVASRLREEAALVQRAERLLDADPAGALRLVDERRRRFPTGALDQEAEVVAIDALLRLGRRADAAARARTFEAAHAGSLHARRIKRLMGQ